MQYTSVVQQNHVCHCVGLFYSRFNAEILCHFEFVQHSTIQDSSVQFRVNQHSVNQYSVNQYSVNQCSVNQCSVKPYSVNQYGVNQYSVNQCSPTQTLVPVMSGAAAVMGNTLLLYSTVWYCSNTLLLYATVWYCMLVRSNTFHWDFTLV